MAKKLPVTKELVRLVDRLHKKGTPNIIIKARISQQTGWKKTKTLSAFNEILDILHKNERATSFKQNNVESSYHIDKIESPRILYIDIETAPSLGYVWGKWEQNVIKFKEDWYILSFAFKWLGDKKVQTRTLLDYKSLSNDLQNDRFLVKELWRLFNEADIIIAHHGDGFDIKKSNARFVFHGFEPPSPYKSVDTLKIARKHFKFDSNKLDDLAQYLGVGKKLPHEGAHTWFGCMMGDIKSWEIMRKYNAHDITLLEGVYLKLRAWTTTHPNLDSFNKNGSCPVCQSTRIQRRGWNVSKTGKKARFQCQNPTCGNWFSGLKHIKTI